MKMITMKDEKSNRAAKVEGGHLPPSIRAVIVDPINFNLNLT